MTEFRELTTHEMTAAEGGAIPLVAALVGLGVMAAGVIAALSGLFGAGLQFEIQGIMNSAPDVSSGGSGSYNLEGYGYYV